MFKKSKILLIFLSIFLLSGCGVDSIEVNNPLTEEEIISYVENNIYDETGDHVTAKIIEKKQLEVCTDWFDTCWKYQDVEGGYSYEIEIINNDNNKIVANGTYEDGYIEYDTKYTNGKKESDSNFTNNYKEQKGLFLIKNEFISALNKKFNKYFIYENVSSSEGYSIFINSSDYNQINDLLLNFKDIVTKYRNDVHISYSVYIYKDENIYNTTNFELYNIKGENYRNQLDGKNMIEQYTGKEVTRIGSGKGFDYDLFISNGASDAEINDEYIDHNTFDYIVFWYQAGTNSFVDNDTSSLQIFGIK